ncbi:ABC transporter ATP-binding protein [Myxococcus sp. AB025B]|uniref:ATP-binding cassette domain-containing protein n=1 Tax=Myxococcus sp. AB025B TaxID=2562794 RepID=UPI0011450503|nr:ABC transporter ATP-binding protein [Myxococcus sp. AB025B]
MTRANSDLLWPVERLPDALEQLAQRQGYGRAGGEISPPAAAVEPSRVWMFALGDRLGVELEPITPLYHELPDVLARAAPCILQVRRDGVPSYLVLLGTRRGKLRLLACDGTAVLVPKKSALALLREEQEATAAEVDQLLGGVEMSPRAREHARSQMLLQRLGQAQLRTGWIMRPRRTASRRTLLGDIPSLIAGILVSHTLLSLVLAFSFWLLGRAALQAHLETGWFLGWIAVIACAIPLRMLEVWWQGVFSIRLGTLLKQQLLTGTLKLTPDEVRLDGIGRHFGRVAESEVVEQLAVGGALLAVLSLVDLVLAGGILVLGAGGWPQALVLVLWVVVAFVLARRHYGVQRAWSSARVEITHDLLERMLGHRTRLAQLPLERWHDGEDIRLSAYSEVSKVMDRRTMQLTALLRDGWLVLALLTLLPAFSTGTANASALAVSVGGILLALRAFDEVAVYFQQVSQAAVSFEQIRDLLAAVGRPELESKVPLEMEGGKPTDADSGTLIEARGLTFRHDARTRPVIENCSFQIAKDDRILLEGPSGGGKSTLVSLLTGLRSPQGGVMLLHALDRATFGASGWRKRVTAAPQFHENHVLSGSFAYNLLLGREWPTSPELRAKAAALCKELGLDELIAKMPAGLEEMIGETGWQLSHGEKSRLYIARTLLQGVELVILDESFASLDPETMRVAQRCVLNHAKALVVVSHP